MLNLTQDDPLPALRPDMQLHEAPAEPDGAPAWTLYDPAANKYYKIGWLEFECLSRFSRCQTVSQLLKSVAKETTLEPTEENVKGMIFFLASHNLVQASGDKASAYFESERVKKVRPWWGKILHHYLFFTLPLFKPKAFLNRTFPYVSFFFTRPFMLGVLALLAYGMILSVQRLDEFSTTFMNYLNMEGAVLLLVSTIVVKIVHELAHAYAATKYGVPISVMGIAFMVLYPMLYSETTGAWKMKNRRERLYISLAGVMAELALASVALISWHFLWPGPLQSLCFMIAVVSLVASLLVNLNPLMRFDGYYVFSDIVGVDNLQDRAFSLMKWKIRQWLWGWKDEPPEHLPDHRRHLMLTFGFATCIYRFFLFLGIALLVYHIFFQPLGLVLMLVELAFFIVMPIFREMLVWWGRLPEIAASTRGKIVGACAAVFLVFLCLPVYGRVEIPAVLHAGTYKKLYAPVPAQIEDILVRSGDPIKPGQVLFRLSSPELDYNIKLVSQRLRDLKSIRDSSQATLDLAQKRLTIDEEIKATQKELAGHQAIREQLFIRAAYEGFIRDVDPSLSVGQWVNTDHLLAYVVNDKTYSLSGYVQERDAGRLHSGAEGVFYPEFSPYQRYNVVLGRIDRTSLYNIFWSELASPHNGPVPAERSNNGGLKTLPRYTFYPVDFSLKREDGSLKAPDFVARGTILVDADPGSFIGWIIRKTNSFFMQDSGL